MRKKQLCAECLFFGIVLIFAVTLKQAEQPQVNIEKHRDDHSGYEGYHEKVFLPDLPGSRESTKMAAYNSKIMTTAVRARMRFNF